MRRILVVMLFGLAATAAPPHHRPPDNRPPPHESRNRPDSVVVDVRNDLGDHGLSVGDVTAGSSSATGGSVGDINVEGSEGGEGGDATADASLVNETPDDVLLWNFTPPAVVPPAASSSNPCWIPESGGFSLPVFGKSKMRGEIDERCIKMETARIAPTIELRIFAWRQLDVAREWFASPKECVAYTSTKPADGGAGDDLGKADLPATGTAPATQLAEVDASIVARIQRQIDAVDEKIDRVAKRKPEVVITPERDPRVDVLTENVEAAWQKLQRIEAERKREDG